jgi:hypothetical protein
MKTNQYLFKLSVFAVLLFTGVHVYSSSRMSASTKSNQTLLVEFFETDTIIIVVPEACELNAIDKADIENVIFWENDQLRPDFVYLSESEVTKKDLKKHVLFYGCITKFQRNEFFKIPLKKSKSGFRFNNRKFDHQSDSFFYVSSKADRMYLCKNDANARHQFFSMGGTPYPMHIFSDDKIVVTGVM